MAKPERYNYALPEQIFLLTQYYKLHADCKMLLEMFAEQFPNAPITQCSYIHKLYQKCQRIGSVMDAPRSRWSRTARTEENAMLDANQS